MAKLRQTDKRPKHRFEPGDIVQNKNGMNGLVLATEPAQEKVHGPGSQWCFCVFAGKEVDLFRQARMFMQRSSHERSQRIRDMAEHGMATSGTALLNTRISFIRKAPDSWVQSITPQEVLNMRFAFIFEEDD